MARITARVWRLGGGFLWPPDAARPSIDRGSWEPPFLYRSVPSKARLYRDSSQFHALFRNALQTVLVCCKVFACWNLFALYAFTTRLMGQDNKSATQQRK